MLWLKNNFTRLKLNRHLNSVDLDMMEFLIQLKKLSEIKATVSKDLMQ